MRPVIKWSGSKRNQANTIIEYFPDSYDCYYEPFLGGGSMLYSVNHKKSVCGDICTPLIELWKEIEKKPKELAESYRHRWNRLQTEGHEVYYEIRDNFNKNQNPEDLLFLSRTCVNGLIRFNSKGEFNNSLHHTRPGIKPDTLEKIILDWSNRIKGTEFLASDYRQTTANAKEGDLIYLDPPYFYTKGRYYGGIDFDDFINYLEDLNNRKIKYILSFDGIRGDESFLVDIPKKLYKRHVLIPSGHSSFKKVMDQKNLEVYESLYLNWD